MTVAEANVPEKMLNLFIGEDGFFSMVFDFSYTDIDVPDTGEWFHPRKFTVEELQENLFKSQKMVQEKGWGAVYLENHDQNRSVNKYIPDKDIDYYSKTMLASMFMFLRGTPFIYQGQELGMENIRMDSLEKYDDIATKGQYDRALKFGISPKEAFEIVVKRSRDNSRTPMQWDDSDYAGFSTAEPWLEVNGNYRQINARSQEGCEKSVLKFYRKLVALRMSSKYSPVIVYGEFVPFYTEDVSVIAYLRILDSRELLVIHNYQDHNGSIKIPDGFKERVIGNREPKIIQTGVLSGTI